MPAAAPGSAAPWRTVGRVLSSAAWLLAAVVVAHFLVGSYQRYGTLDPAAYGMFWTRRAWLWLHLSGGALTAVLGALQLISAVRRRHPRVHRWIGRVYLLAMLVASVGVVGLIATSPAGVWISAAFAATGLAWGITAGAGFIAIRRRQVQLHQRWMVRNYIVTLAPMLFRLSIQIPGVLALVSPTVAIPALLVLSWLLPLALWETGACIARRARGRGGSHAGAVDGLVRE